MTLAAFLSLTTQWGPVHGSARQKNRERKIFVSGFDHVIQSQRYTDEPLTTPGMPSTKRYHGGFVITKPIDRSTPILHRMMAVGEPAQSWKMECWRIPPAGGGPSGVNEENHWKVTLEGARIATIRTVLANVRIPLNSPLPEYEEVEWTYDTIKFEWEALTGEGAQVFKHTGPRLPGDFSKLDLLGVGNQLAASLSRKFGAAAGKQFSDFMKAEGKQILGDLLKEK
jgi:type VI secretion system secreted protein Hcp